MTVCTSCGGRHVAKDYDNYILVCVDCGCVLEESQIVEGYRPRSNFSVDPQSITSNRDEKRIYHNNIRKVFQFFKFSEEELNVAFRFYRRNKTKIVRTKTLETALVLASLIGSSYRSGWLASDYATDYPEEVDMNSLSAIYLSLAPIFGSFEKADSLETQLVYVIDKIYKPVVSQLQKRLRKSYQDIKKHELTNIADDLLHLLKQFGVTESARMRPFICAAVLVSSQYLQGKRTNKSRSKSLKKSWDFNPISKLLEISSQKLRQRFNQIMEFLDACMSRLFQLPASDAKCTVYYLEEIIEVFGDQELRQFLPDYQVPTIKRADEKREDTLKALKNAKNTFDNKETPPTTNTLHFFAWNLLIRGFKYEELKEWHVSLIFAKSRAILFKETMGTTTIPPDLDDPRVTYLDMADHEVNLYL